jgi:hypothetical protein
VTNKELREKLDEFPDELIIKLDTAIELRDASGRIMGGIGNNHTYTLLWRDGGTAYDVQYHNQPKEKSNETR